MDFFMPGVASGFRGFPSKGGGRLAKAGRAMVGMGKKVSFKVLLAQNGKMLQSF